MVCVEREAAARRRSFKDAAAELNLTASAVSHAIQMHDRYYEEFERCGWNKRRAIVASFAELFVPTFSGISTDALGVLVILLVPVLMFWFVRGQIRDERSNPLNRALIALYRPLLAIVLRFPWTTLLAALLVLAAITVGGIIKGKVTDKANSIQL